MSARDDYPPTCGWPWDDLDDLEFIEVTGVSYRGAMAEIDQLRTQVDLLRLALTGLANHEDQPCRFDHHGYCQEHPGGFGWEGCGIAIARSALGLTHSPILPPNDGI